MRLSNGNRILPVALVAALLGGTVGAFVTRTSKTTEPAEKSALASSFANDDYATNRENKTLTPEQSLMINDGTSNNAEPKYRTGFADGFRAGAENDSIQPMRYTSSKRAVRTTRVIERPVYRNTRARSSRYDNSRQVYYDYNTQPRKRSFWQKHRDKLTVAAGAGGGALIGGLIGGKKGAAIGALAGGGGSALYTYKIRKRDRRY